MLKERVFVLTEDEYRFINLLDTHFKNIEVHQDINSLIGRISYFNSVEKNNNLFILFIEFSLLEQTTLLLNQELDSLHYILISFSSKEILNISRYNNLFEFINLSENYNFDFLFKKITSEINNKNKISLLQSEVKEFYEIGKSLSSEKDTLKLFDMIINSSMNLTSSDAGTMYLVVDKNTGKWSTIDNNSNNDSKLLKFAIAKNTSIKVQFEESLTPITKESIFGYTILTGQSIRIDDVYNATEKADYIHNRSFDIKAGYKTKSILSIPMMDYDNKIMGVIQLINKKRYNDEVIDYTNDDSLNNIIPFDYTDELIMNSLAGQAAVALENNLLYSELQEILKSYKKQNEQLLFLSRKVLKAHEEERRRIAREIHDGPAQSTANLSLKVDIGKKFLQKNDISSGLLELDSIKKDLQATIKEIRTIIYDLKPSYLENGLIAALDNRLSLFRENTGIDVIFNLNGDDTKVEYYVSTTIYRIVQEIFSNIAKHANATRVWFNFHIFEKEILFRISDDGKGFDLINNINDPKKKLEGGFGLEGIKERLQLVNGTININSALGEGTNIEIKIPLADK